MCSIFWEPHFQARFIEEKPKCGSISKDALVVFKDWFDRGWHSQSTFSLKSAVQTLETSGGDVMSFAVGLTAQRGHNWRKYGESIDCRPDPGRLHDERYNTWIYTVRRSTSHDASKSTAFEHRRLIFSPRLIQSLCS